MSKYLEKAEKLRAIVEPHHNCAQSVLMAFVPDIGMDDNTAYKVAANFGAGMKCGSVCGAVTGGLMALGLLGIDDPAVIKEFINKIKNNHQGCLDCVDLLKINKDAGGDKKQHCDAMVYECVKAVEELIRK